VPGLENMVITDYVAGGYNSCIINDLGALYCWGTNNSKELGNPAFFRWASEAPILVSGMDSGVLAISIGNSFMCALKTNGDAYCWGLDYYQSYTGGMDWVYRPEPVKVGHIDDPKDIYSNGGHTCMLSNTGIAMCWGLGGSGQLGNGQSLDQESPVQVSNLTNIDSMSLGETHTCAITKASETITSKLWCWGDYSNGKLGVDPSVIGSGNLPIEVTGLLGSPLAVAAGKEHTCAIIQNEVDSSVMCWGYNQEGQLGIGNTTSMSLPTEVPESSGAKEISAGESFTSIVITNGEIKSWGANTEGQLGNGFFFRRQLPIHLNSLLEPIEDVVSGENHTCALTQTGNVYCWGSNLYGQLGNGTTDYSKDPVKVLNLDSKVNSIAAGPFHTCVLLASGEAKCWGYNMSGILGTGDLYTTNLSTPEFVIDADTSLPLANIEKITTGGWHNCALMMGGSIKCWGSDLFGQLGMEPPTESYMVAYPVDVPFLGIFTDVSAGLDHTCAVANNGSAYCWGVNYNGELGIGSSDFDPHPIPTQVINLNPNVSAIESGGRKTCILTNTGGVSCWGGSSIDHTAIQIPGLESGVEAISTGGALTYMEYHTCALMETSGAVKCWGYNNFSQLGDGTYRFFGENTPVDVLGLTGNAFKINTGATSTCALFESGAATCWGSDYQIKTTPELLVEVDEMYRPASIFFSNYYEGSPGSYFVITGLYFPPNEYVNININGEQVGSVLANETGVFKFFTYFEIEGEYSVTVSSSGIKSSIDENETILTTKATTPIIGQGEVLINVTEGLSNRIKEGDGLTISLGSEKLIFIPLIIR
jgi:alpha-tubulin suppressor-like RCC1 family protein